MALASNPKIINCKTIEEVRKLQVNIHELDILTPEPLLKEEDIKIVKFYYLIYLFTMLNRIKKLKVIAP